MSKRRLPPLNPLRNFESAARRGSFVRAAEELNVTPVAVSRQVGVLEDYFGKPLFVRHANTIALTDHGRALLPSVTTALDTLADGARRLRAATDTPVVVCTYQAFAMHWLIPRMRGFTAANPEINLNLTTANTPEEFEQARADIVIKYGHAPQAGHDARPILPDIVMPVCSPALRDGTAPLPPVSNLAAHTLLRARYRRLDWPSWLAIMDAQNLAPAHELTFRESGLANQASAEGLGVAIAQRLLVHEALADGRLVMPFATALRRVDDIWMSWRADRADDAHVARVRDWIAAEAGNTVAGFGIDYAPADFDAPRAVTLPATPA